MFRLFLVLGGLTTVACTPLTDNRPDIRPDAPHAMPPQPASPQTVTPPPPSQAVATAIPQAVIPTSQTPKQKPAHNKATTRKSHPPQPVRAPAYYRTTSQGVGLAMVCFDDRQDQLRVADQPNGCGSRWADARSAARSYNGLAAVNGGFFTPEDKPLGLLIETGTRRGAINKSSLGAGMFVSSPSGSAIIRRERFPTSRLAAMADNLLQAGPMLVEHGKAVAGLSRDKHRPRSFIAWDGRHRWAIGYAEPCSLGGLAAALANASPDGFKAVTALNLDGGRSSDFWVSTSVRNGGKTHRSFLNKPVRNYLVLISR